MTYEVTKILVIPLRMWLLTLCILATTAQGGQECDRGYWCAAGAAEMTECLPGTYNPDRRVSGY